jgi:hypothetical protein
MGLALALAGCVIFIAGLLFAILWLIPPLRRQHPKLGRSAGWGLIVGFLLFLGGGLVLSADKKSKQPLPSDASARPLAPTRVPNIDSKD